MEHSSFRLLNDTWVMKRRVGKGTFSELFLAKNILFRGGGQQVAVKLQNEGTESVVVRHEADVMRNLSGLPTVPAYIHHGQYKNREFLVMELLGGEDMSSLRDRVRASSESRLVPLPAAAYLARQMLTCIKNIHDRGYIHRDIKPANFVRRERASTQFCMIDFGVAKQFRDKHGVLKPKRENAEFRGTVQYASPFVHDGQDQCPRDDLYSLVFVFIDLVCGKLPWAEAYRQSKDKAAAAATKRSLLDEPEKMVKWVRDTVVAAERVGRSDGRPQSAAELGGPAEEGEEEIFVEAVNFPKEAQEATLALIKHLQGLSYDSLPDYSFIKSTFESLHPPDHPDVGEPMYEFQGFRWTGGKDNRLPTGADAESDRPTHDLRAMHRYLMVRGSQLGKWLQKAKAKAAAGAGNDGGNGGSASNSQSSNNGSSGGSSQPRRDSSSFPNPTSPSQQPPATLLEYAGMWSELCADFRAVSEEDAAREAAELMLGVLKDAGRFWLLDVDDEAAAGQADPSGGLSFRDWRKRQRDNDALAETCLRVLKRPRQVVPFGYKQTN